MSPYRPDLAYVQDAAFGDFAEHAAPGLLELLKSAGKTSGRVLDLGCGAGVLARCLTAAGHDVVGIDSSRALVAHARRRAPKARFQIGSVFEVDLPSDCVLVTAIGEVLSYGGRDLAPLFRRVRRALEPDGLFVFDLPTPANDWPGGGHLEGRDWALLWDVELRSKRRLVRNITTFRKIGRSYRRRHEVHELRLYDRREVLAKLDACGFSAEASTRYGSMELLPRRVAYIAHTTTG